MARGQSHPPETRAAAIRLHLAGKSPLEIARELGVDKSTVAGWVRMYRPLSIQNASQAYARTREELSDLVYAAIIDTIQAIRARAAATSDRAWIQGQSADALAELDATQWQFVIRVLGAYRPPEEPDDGDPEPAADVHRNGTVDPAT